MNITGLTGHSGSGKTTVAHIMSDMGFYHIDCDKLVHENVYSDKKVIDKIRNVFGSEYISHDGILNRRELGRLVFSDKDAYNTLMETISPDIISALNAEIENNKNKYILLDAPALFEYDLAGICNRIIAVVSKNAVKRICRRDGITTTEARNRLKSQKSIDFYKSNCNILIENDMDLDTLTKTVKAISKDILEE